MMKIELVVMFGKRGEFYRFLQDLDRGAALEKRLIRSRLTERGAWMKLALQGPAARLEEIVDGWRGAIAAFTRISA